MKRKVTAFMLAFALILSSFVNVNARPVETDSPNDAPVADGANLATQVNDAASVKNTYSIAADTYVIGKDANNFEIDKKNVVIDTENAATVEVKIGTDTTATQLKASNESTPAVSSDDIYGKTVNYTVTPKSGTTISAIYTIYQLSWDTKVTQLKLDKANNNQTTDGEGKVTGSFWMPGGNVIIAVVLGNTITVKSSEHGFVGVEVDGDKATAESITGGEVYKVTQDAAIKLVVEPEDGYELDSLTVKNGSEDVDVKDDAFTMPKGNVTVEATFKPATSFTITVKSSEHGFVGVEVGGDKATAKSTSDGEVYTVAKDAAIKLVAEPEDGYELDSLTVKNGSEDVDVEDDAFTMPEGNVTVEATFKPATSFTITVKSSEHGFVGVEVDGDKATAKSTSDGEVYTVAKDAAIKLVVEPEDGYELEALTVKNGSEDVDVKDDAFTMPDADVTVQAKFVKVITVTLPKETDNGEVYFIDSDAKALTIRSKTFEKDATDEAKKPVIMIVPDEGYEVGTFTVNGEDKLSNLGAKTGTIKYFLANDEDQKVEITFVKSGPNNTITKVTPTGNSYAITLEGDQLADTTDKGIVVVALYNADGKMIGVKTDTAAESVTIAFEESDITKGETVGTYKVMWVTSAYVPVAAAYSSADAQS